MARATVMDAEVAIAYEQRVYLTTRQVRCCVRGSWSDWHDLTPDDARALDVEAVRPAGECPDKAAREAMYRIARACWPLAEAIENGGT